MESCDAGKSWSQARVVVDTPLDDRDAGLCIMADGTMIISWVSSHYSDYHSLFKRFMTRPGLPQNRWDAWEQKIAEITPEDVRQWAPSVSLALKSCQPSRWMGFWTMRSHDRGLSWDIPTASPVFAPHGPGCADDNLFYVGLAPPLQGSDFHDIGVARSEDQGRTWRTLARLSSRLPYPGGVEGGTSRLAEPHVTRARSGRLVAMARYEESGAPEQSYLWQFESDDEGQTWSQPHRSSLLGKPPHLLTLRDGRLVASYGFRLPPSGQRISLSTDEGRSWGNPVILRDDAPNRDLGYATSAECADGTIVTIYYQVEKEGAPPSLMASRLSPGELR